MVKNKTGDLTLNQVVILVMVIASFAIVLFLYGLYSWQPTIDKEACHESVVIRSTFNAGPIEAGKNVVPLKCETEKICMTMSGESCDEFGEASKVNKITTVRLSKNKEKAEEKIKDTISDILLDCHTMVGEGKLNFMPNPKVTTQKYCLVCSRFALDKEAKAVVDDLTYVDLYQYMKSKDTPGGSNYLEATYDVGRVNDMMEILNKVRQLVVENEEVDEEVKRGYTSVYDLKIDMQIENAVIVQIIPKSALGTLLKAGGIVIGGTAAAVVGVIASPFSLGSSLGLAGVGIGMVGSGITSAVFIYKDFPGDKFRYVYPTVYPYELSALKWLECNSFETAP